MFRAVIGVIAVFAGIALMLRDAPRALFDFQHADEFVEARGLEITEAKCTTWNLAILGHCEIAYQSRDGKQWGELDDWKFGTAPTGAVQLMQWRDDPSVVTTDVSLAIVRSRLVFAVTLVVGGLLFAFALAAKMLHRMRPSY